MSRDMTCPFCHGNGCSICAHMGSLSLRDAGEMLREMRATLVAITEYPLLAADLARTALANLEPA